MSNSKLQLLVFCAWYAGLEAARSITVATAGAWAQYGLPGSEVWPSLLVIGAMPLVILLVARPPGNVATSIGCGQAAGLGAGLVVGLASSLHSPAYWF